MSKENKELLNRIESLEKTIKSFEGFNKQSYRKQFTPEEFKKVFKVGDKICGWSTGKVVIITAIGEKRFLAKCTYNKIKEGSHTMESNTWVKIK